MNRDMQIDVMLSECQARVEAKAKSWSYPSTIAAENMKKYLMPPGIVWP